MQTQHIAITYLYKLAKEKKSKDPFTVVHPLYDEPERKCDVDSAPPLHITKTVRISLIILRAYLIIIIVLAIYRMLFLGGIV